MAKYRLTGPMDRDTAFYLLRCMRGGHVPEAIQLDGRDLKDVNREAIDYALALIGEKGRRESKYQYNRGGLSKVEKKMMESSPDYMGDAEIGGIKYEVSAWLRTFKCNGMSSMSLKFKEAQS